MSVMDAWLKGRSHDSEAQRLRDLRDRGLSQKEAADALGITQSTVSRKAKKHGIRWPHGGHRRPDRARILVPYKGKPTCLHEIAVREGLIPRVVWARYQRGRRGVRLWEPTTRQRRYTVDLTEAQCQAIVDDYWHGPGSKTKKPIESVANRWRLPQGAVRAIIRGQWHLLVWAEMEDAA